MAMMTVAIFLITLSLTSSKIGVCILKRTFRGRQAAVRWAVNVRWYQQIYLRSSGNITWDIPLNFAT
jgi:hypothetical protein